MKTHEQEERVNSFFLAETTNYLYLLFDEHNFIHPSNGSVDQQIKATQSPSCNPGSAGYIFNTEAHPIDIGEIHCSSPLRLTYIPEELFRTRDMLIENSQELNYESNEDLNDEEDVEKTFTAAYTCKRCLHLQGACTCKVLALARCLHLQSACKRFSVLGAFFEGSEETP